MNNLIDKIWNWKTKTLLVVTLLAAFTYWLGSLNRDNGQSTWANWYDCKGEGWNVEQESEYTILANKCAIIYYNEDGTVAKRVPARLNVNTAEAVDVTIGE
ncbi:hypothetical protein [Vibrio phage BUCT194]|uniref:Uncharacterized protein n=1 Tax=Vibrio phage BUCT194 TaxID=2859072 RepID=A0AAE8XFM0_9CAUD|nr:hypothetical protein PP741_gp010 [Vibrio phage BUCT194]UAW01117.1 hypothetical protein [Vibrio phage BUCT194]